MVIILNGRSKRNSIIKPSLLLAFYLVLAYNVIAKLLKN